MTVKYIEIKRKMIKKKERAEVWYIVNNVIIVFINREHTSGEQEALKE